MTHQAAVLQRPHVDQGAEEDRYIQSFCALVGQNTFASFMWEQIPRHKRESLQNSLKERWLPEQATTEGVDLPMLIQNVRMCDVQLSQADQDRLYRIARESDEKRGLRPKKVVLG